MAAWAIPPVLSPGSRPPGSRCPVETTQRKGFQGQAPSGTDQRFSGWSHSFPSRAAHTEPSAAPRLAPHTALRGDQGVALELAHVAASWTLCVSNTTALPEAPETSWPSVPLAIPSTAGVPRVAALLARGRSSRPPTPPVDFPTTASLRLAASRGAGPRGLLWGGRGRGQGPGKCWAGGKRGKSRKGAEPGSGRSPGGLGWGGAGHGVEDSREGARVAGDYLRNWGAERGMNPAPAVEGSRCWVRRSGCVTRRRGAVGRSSARDGKGRVGEIALSESPLRPRLLPRASLPHHPRPHLNSDSS